MKRRNRMAGLLALAGAAAITNAWAEPRPEKVPTPGRALASTQDGTALALNPANLTFLPGADFRWLWVHTGDASESSARGHAVSVAGAFPFGLGTGVRLDFVRPPGGAVAPFDKPYAWLTWGLSMGAEEAALGLSVQHIYSQDPRVGGLTSLTLGWTGRIGRHGSLSAVAYDLNAPHARFRDAYLDRSYAFGLALRPLGTRAMELGLEARYYEDDARVPGRSEHWMPRATLGLDVPYVGTLRGDVSVHDPGTASERSYVASATLDLPLGYTTLTGGGTFGTAIGGRAGAGFISGIAVSSWLEPGLPMPKHALKIRIERTPGVRGHVHLLRELWALAKDDDVNAIVFHLKTSPAESLAAADELDDAVRLLRAHGKKVICHLEDAGGRAMHMCAHADRIVVNPAGGIRFSGLSLQHIYLAGLLQKVGVRAQFVRIGDYKSAPEQFTNTAPSDASLQVTRENLDQIERDLVATIADGRKVDFATMKRTISGGPFTAREALRDHLVDGFAYDDELRTVASEVVGHSVALLDEPPRKAPRRYGTGRAIALVFVDGHIVDGKSQSMPLLGVKTAGSYTIAKALEQARKDPMVGAVVLRIDSPGGSSMAADVMWREVELTAREKPLIVSMAGVAASGGYYIAVPAKRIYASPFTVTGSIGIFYGKADVEQLFQKLGISVHTVKSAPRADAESIFRPFTDDEVRELGGKVKQFYDVFIDRVARGRHRTPEAVDAVARGRVWMGRAALDHQLIDEIGGLRQAMAEAERLAGLDDEAPVVELPEPEFSLVDVLLDAGGARADVERQAMQNVIPGQVGDVLRAAAPFVLYEPDQPMALSDVTTAP
jgi:protease-4